jgi:flagellar hook-associated protein 2
VLTVTAATGAQPGTFDFDVVTLARSEMEVGNGFDSQTDDVFTGGSISISVAGASPPTQIDIDGASNNTSLSGLADYISDNIDGVEAYVLDDGADTNNYHLVVVSEETGSSQTVTLDTSLLQGDALTFTEAIAAQDAQLDIAGLAVFSESNTFEDVIPGLTFEALSEGDAIVTVAPDTEGVVEAVQTFVDSYNQAMSFIDSYTGIGANDSISALASESSVLRQVQTALQSSMAGMYVAGDLQGASILGFSTEQDGSLALDTDKLTDVLGDNYSDALEILAGTDGIFQSLDGKLDVIVDPDEGTLALRTESLDEQIEAFEDQIAADEARLETYEDTLRQQFTNLEMTLAELQSMSSFVTALFSNMLGGSS